MFTQLERHREDRIFRLLVVLALLLEIVVYIEPAPVDALIVVCIGGGLIFRKLVFPTLGTAPVLSLAVFAMANLVSMYDLIDPEHGLQYVLVTFYLVASWFFFVGVASRYGKPFIATMINAYCLAGVFSALIGIAAYYNVIPFQDRLLMGGRVRGLFKDCNVYGPFFVPVALFALMRILDGRSRWHEKITPLIALGSSLLAMLLCYSRACWINFSIALVFFLGGQVAFPGLRKQLSTKELSQRIRIATFVLAAGTAAVATLVVSPSVSGMLAERVTASGLQNYDRIRFATQAVALETAAERPFGIGPGQVEENFDYATHSMYLRILSENGIVALIAVLVFIGATIARSVSVIEHAGDPWFRDINLVVLACIVGHLVNSVVIDTVHWRHIWFIYALPWAPAQLQRYARRAAASVPRMRSDPRRVFATPGFTGR
jgi:O-antigen ligase